jgi:pimeloyl-ACP methyl ester carboxylesterase
MARTGYRVFIFDYRGYGKSTGISTEAGLYEDARAGLKWLHDNNRVTDTTVWIMYGYSMGTAPACELTAHYQENPYQMKPSRLILESPFASAEIMVQDASGLALPGSYIVNLKIDNAEEIKTVDIPFLWLHGQLDDFLNIATHGETVFRNYPGPAGYPYRVPEAGHGNVPKYIGLSAYIDGLRAFISGNSQPFGIVPQ